MTSEVLLLSLFIRLERLKLLLLLPVLPCVYLQYLGCNVIFSVRGYSNRTNTTTS